MQTKEGRAEILNDFITAVQVCVPEDWSEEKILAFVEVTTDMKPSRIIDDPAELCGDEPRVNCKERKGFIHCVVEF